MAVKAPRFINGIQVPADAKLTLLSDLVPFEDNPRDHPEDEVRALAAFITEVGFIVPVVVDAEGNVAGGHARILAARALGMDRVPTTRVEYLTKKQRLAFVVADNKLPAMARWNPGKLSLVLEELRLDYPDLRLVGFTDEEMKRLRDDVDRLRLDPPSDPPRGRQSNPRPRDDDDDDDDDDEPEDLVPFQVLLSVEERAEVYAAIRKVKDRDGTQAGAALLTIVREWTP